ncbi:trypco2 family protein [Streptomyces sp. NRRL WC-3742]|uniref:trypco2 family protein n=1 Tax=Streptomyces sp. NRRL WC-3742 TaxID=1463934 RepID=UPI0004C896EB|nr:trypco2 family protein [Streptomyces sp. NRRL WC-3742]
MSGSDEDDRWMDLADAVDQLRLQIATAQRRMEENPDRGVRFEMGEITLELGLELTRTKGVDGGLKWSVVSLGGKKENGAKSTHKLTVKLNPHKPGGGAIDISDEE